MTDFETHPAGTTDLVKRLRSYQEFEQNRDGQIVCVESEIANEAADRIEQLVATVEQLEAAHRAVMEEHDYTAKRLGHAFERIDRQAETIDKLTARANAATAAAYEVAAQMVETTAYTSNGDTRSLEPVAAGLSGMDMHHATIATAIRALATPDQTAALDKLIAEAEARVWEKAAVIAYDYTPEKHSGATLASHVTGRSIEAAILAASKKGGV